jgi:gliding motility-associated-like protein
MIKLYARTITVVFLFVLSIISSIKVKASHAMGADCTYEYIGPNQYLVTFSFYRDCSGIPAPSLLSLDIANSCGYVVPTVNLVPTPTSPTQISPLCPSDSSTCDGGTFTGIQEWVYTGIVTLPGACADWTFSHTESARNTAITTSGGGNLFVYSTLNNLNGIINNSPTFSNKPVPFACAGQTFNFNHGAYDAEGDSLTYQIITPRTGDLPSDTVIYNSPYSPTQPVISSPPMTFSPSNGDFRMKPSQTDVTILAILVNEYRNGVLIGQVERDIQITVLNCNNVLPLLTGINYNPSFATSVCAGNQLCFNIRSIDPDPTNNTTITWDNSIPGATFTTIPGAHRDSATFCWTPSAADISSTPYCFTATVSDDNCPYIGVQAYAYCITVKGVAPDAGIDQTIPCGATANLTGNATGGNGIFNFTWDPGNVNSQQLNSVGVGTYILTVTSAGCSNKDTVDILAGLGVPSAYFSYQTTCSNSPVVFTDSSLVSGSTITGWTWDFGDGASDISQSPSHQYASNGTYTVTLTVSTPTNCTASITKQVVVNTNIPTAQFSSINVCDGTVMNFTDQSLGTPNSWAWDFGDPTSGSNTSSSQNSSHTFTGPGSYTVGLSVTNAAGCQNQIQQSVTVHPNPVINVPPAGMCEGAQATLNGPPGFASYSWSNSQNTQSITVSPLATSTYTLTVIDNNGCTGNYTATVNVDPAPIADAGVFQTICEGTNANLSGNGGTNYTWNPGNIPGQNINVSPSSSTLYTVTVASNAGCTSTDTVTVIVNPMPVITAGNDLQLCSGQSVTINSTVSNGNIIWTPGNYNTASITVTPVATTTYLLSVSDAIGCSATDEVTVVVNEIPTANFSSSGSICEDNLVTFQDLSNVISGTINNWNWDFGNNQTSVNQNPQIQFSDPGNYNVRLIVTSNGACSDTININQDIWARPVASFSHNNVCFGLPINFTNNSSISDASNLNYSWDLGDNTTSGSTNISHQYSSYGGYNTKLIVTSINGCVDSINSLVNIYPLPQANFTAVFTCEGTPTQFNDGSSIAQGSIAQWQWSFGDNTSATSANPSHTYTQSGSYNIQLKIASDQGCPDSTNKLIRVVPNPVVDFSTENACLGYPVNLKDLSQPVTGSIVQYSWDFGDGSTSTVQDPQHAYASSGSFQVTLTATTDSGCSTTLERPSALTIFALPNVTFSSNSSESSDIFPQVSFFNQTGSTGTYYWSFGDGDTSAEYSPTHMYPTTGFYDVWLTAINLNGCIDSSLLKIEIKPTSNIYIPTAFTPNGDLQNDYFRIYSYNVKDVKVQIYDRWGLKIIEWNDPVGAWDGKVNGTPVQADVYVYRVSTVDVNEKREVIVGHVSLVR